MNKDKLLCLFCGCPVPEHHDTFKEHEIQFSRLIRGDHVEFDTRDKLVVQELNCPNCNNISIDIVGIGSQYRDRVIHFNPISLAKIYPDYIPKAIREDYEEAHAILNLSPKASATLSRRCLQGMIRDFWKISKGRLVDEIEALKELVDPSTKSVLDALRKLGNIGAHPEKDVNLIVDIEPNEALKLLKFIELLMQKWYVERHENELLLQDILELDKEKQSKRKTNQ
ncbi:DUF4145 domain-containing protein [Streptococcus minor]|uniref:DUF4145 domain-containing protein n=1 Tax=Streptococcus minor TaxID=229549 RepID=UPI001639F236|nr:DUF4145 domain-containing protein [Streptococcus minor]